eukprot:jgi/Chrpa1/14807/Chrysochromulina_OHIO_Genome00005838-RA
MEQTLKRAEQDLMQKQSETPRPVVGMVATAYGVQHSLQLEQKLEVLQRQVHGGARGMPSAWRRASEVERKLNAARETGAAARVQVAMLRGESKRKGQRIAQLQALIDDLEKDNRALRARLSAEGQGSIEKPLPGFAATAVDTCLNAAVRASERLLAAGLGDIRRPDEQVALHAIREEHTAGADAKLRFTADDLAQPTFALAEYWFVADPINGLKSAGLVEWPPFHSRRAAVPVPSEPYHPTTLSAATARTILRKGKTWAQLSPAVQEVNARLAELGHAPLSSAERITARLFTGPMGQKYDALLKHATHPSADNMRRCDELCAGNGYRVTLALLHNTLSRLALLGPTGTPLYRTLTCTEAAAVWRAAASNDTCSAGALGCVVERSAALAVADVAALAIDALVHRAGEKTADAPWRRDGEAPGRGSAGGGFDLPIDAIMHLAETATSIHIRIAGDESESVTLKPGVVWPLQQLRRGLPFDKTLHGVDVTPAIARVTWHGPPACVERLWNKGVDRHRESETLRQGRLYLGCGNPNGLHLVAGQHCDFSSGGQQTGGSAVEVWLGEPPEPLLDEGPTGY